MRRMFFFAVLLFQGGRCYKRHLFRLSLVLATVGLLSLAIPAAARDPAEPFRLTGTSKTTEDLGGFPSTPTLRFTIPGEGTIGKFVQIATIHFYWVGGEPAFSVPERICSRSPSSIYVLGEADQPTGDVIYMEAHGADGPGCSGRTEASGSPAVKAFTRAPAGTAASKTYTREYTLG